MSDQIPFHIQEEIMKRLPMKSLVQFRSVSKAWKSLIDSSDFIAAHSLRRHTQPHRLFVSYGCPNRPEDYVLFAHCYSDDETFREQMSVPSLPQSVDQISRPVVVGSSHGVLCLFGCDFQIRTETGVVWDSSIRKPIAVLWNPSIRKSIVVSVPAEPSICQPCAGFGVCPVTSDPKIVVITKSSEVIVYTLSSGKWRSLPTINLPANRSRGSFTSVVTDGFIYWDVQLPDRKMILEFDLTGESFDMIDLPDSLASRDHETNGFIYRDVRISKLRDSLALIRNRENYSPSGNVCTVWIMEHGARKWFTKLFTITTPYAKIAGFRKNGVPIMQVTDDREALFGKIKLVVYEPNLEHNNFHEIGSWYHFYVHSYMETLFLLGRSDYSP